MGLIIGRICRIQQPLKHHVLIVVSLQALPHLRHLQRVVRVEQHLALRVIRAVPLAFAIPVVVNAPNVWIAPPLQNVIHVAHPVKMKQTKPHSYQDCLVEQAETNHNKLCCRSLWRLLLPGDNFGF